MEPSRRWKRLLRALKSGPDGHGSILNNGIWGSLQQFASVGSQALVSFLLIAVMSVEDFGVYSYALVLASIGINFMTAGLSGLAIKILADDPAQSARTVSSLLLVRESLAVVAYISLGLISLTADSEPILVATLLALMVLFGRAADAPEFWFKAQLRTRVPAFARTATIVVLLVVRLGLLLVTSDPLVFLGTYVLESFVASAWIFIRYWRQPASPKLERPSPREAMRLFRTSFPLFISGLANQVNLRGDIILIQIFLGTVSVAVYSAAARISEIAYFIPTAFMNAALPDLVKLHKLHGPNSPEFMRVMQRSYDRAFWAGVLTALCMGGVGSLLIVGVFGEEYEAALPLLWLGLVPCPFIFMAAVYSKWILTVNLLWSSMYRHLLGAGINVGMNIMLLPSVGLIGASISTIVSYVTAAYLACFIGKRTRKTGFQMTLAMIAPIRVLVARGKYWRDN